MGENCYENYQLPLKVLSTQTQELLCDLLNTSFILPCETGLLRDWRGLAELIGIKVNLLENHANPTKKLLQTIANNDEFSKCTINSFLHHLEILDRFDIIDDCNSLIEADVIQHRTLQANVASLSDTPEKFDALVLYAEEDIDFAHNLVDVLEKNFSFNIFFKERNLIAGQREVQSILGVIADKSNKIIVLISPHFLTSPMNEFFLDYAQTIAIELKTRKIIPCMLSECELPAQLLGLHILRYSSFSRWGNFWVRLAKAIDSQRTANQVTCPENVSNLQEKCTKQVETISSVQHSEAMPLTCTAKTKSGKISKILTKVKKILPKTERHEAESNKSVKKKREKKKKIAVMM